MAVAAQFFYVAAQAGIFSFFINYMTAEVPAIPASWQSGMTRWPHTPASCSLAVRLVRSRTRRACWPQRQGRLQPAIAGADLLSGGPVHAAPGC